MTFSPVLPWAILAVVGGSLAFARLVALRQVLLSAGPRRGRAALRWTGVTLVILLLVAAATRPALRNDEIGGRSTPLAGADLNVFVVIDRSASAAVEDYGAGEPRSAGMRADIAAVITRYPAARFAVVGCAAHPSLDWPLSGDVWSLQPVLAALSTPDSGLGESSCAAGNILRYQLIQAEQQYPGSKNAVLYFGVPGSSTSRADIDLRHGSVDGGAVLVYGRSDATNDAELRRNSEELGVPYLQRDPGQPLRLELPSAPIEAGANKRIEIYWLPAMLAAGLLLFEIYLSVREFRRGRVARRDLTS
jgi:hypothetical protein